MAVLWIPAVRSGSVFANNLGGGGVVIVGEGGMIFKSLDPLPGVCTSDI